MVVVRARIGNIGCFSLKLLGGIYYNIGEPRNSMVVHLRPTESRKAESSKYFNPAIPRALPICVLCFEQCVNKHY